MPAVNDRDALDAGSANLSGIRILVVEDSWHIGTALKSLLRALEAEVLGPAATVAEAERLISEQMPDASIVDFNLRGGELANGLIDKLNELGILVIVISGYASVPIAPGKAAAILQKPLVESQLLAALRPLVGQKKSWKGA
jgi:DNA-binding NtrC family response regulator